MKKILVIDDQSEVLDLVSYILDDEGYQVLTADSGREGVQIARGQRPDLILCDIMMKDFNGYEVLRAIRMDLDVATTPFIFLTAKATHKDLRTGMSLGADDYLTKPFTVEELVPAVRAQLDKYKALSDRFQQQINLLRQGLSTILPHELRTPLALILAHSSILKDDLDVLDVESVQESVLSIHESARRLHRLIENLLIYVQLEGDATLRLEHPRPVQVDETVRDAALDRAQAHHRRDDLALHLTPGAAMIHSFHLRKIVEELVDNAFKFSNNQTPVTVDVSRVGDDLALEVRDRGRGLPADAFDRIEAYTQFDRQRFEQQGGGFGLVVVKRVAALYQGELSVSSTSDTGTCISVVLPALWDSLDAQT